MTETAASPAPSLGYSDKVGLIEGELAELWRPIPGEPPKVRASTMDLLVLTEDAPEPGWLAAIDAVSATHPARTLLVSASSTLPATQLDSDVRAICRDDPRGEVICAERVVLRLGEEAASRAASIIAALSTADLPKVVLVIDDPKLLPADALVDGADRLIVDSRTVPLERIDGWFAGASGVVVDLGFIEGFPFRDLAARIFDPEERRPLLRALDKLELRYACDPGGALPGEARLYLGWFVSRLGGSFTGPRSATIGGRPLSIELTSERASPRGAGSILGVTLTGSLHGARAEARIERMPGDRGLASSFEGASEPSHHSFRLIERDEAWLITRALDATEPDSILREAVHAAARWTP